MIYSPANDHVSFTSFFVSKGCKIQTGVYINRGNDVGYIEAKNGQYECASKCASTNDCIEWTFKISNSGCWLKSDASNKDTEEGWITGTKSCGEGSSEGEGTKD